MKNFYLNKRQVTIFNNDGSSRTIYFNSNSGKVYYRYKTGTISQVKHPGIYLGVDYNGMSYFLHNHYHYGKAHITTEQEFRKGQSIYLYSEKCSNSPLKVIEIGLNEIIRGESYRPLTYNCQTYTNSACHNRRTSEDVEKWVGGILMGSLALLVISAVVKG